MVRTPVTAVGILVACSGLNQASLGAPLADDGALRQAGLCNYWAAQVPLQRGESIKDAYLIDDALYLTTDLGTLFAIQADVGLIRWAARLSRPGFNIRRPAHTAGVGHGQYVIVPTTTSVSILDRYSGEAVRKFDPDWAVSSPIAALGNALFMGAMNGRLYCLVWRTREDLPTTVRWQVDVGSPVLASPVLFDGPRLLTTTQAGRIFSSHASDKQFDWTFRTGGPILGDPVVDGESVYVSSMDRGLYRLDANSGWKIWHARFPSPLPEGPLVAGQTVFQFCSGEGLSAVDADTGAKRWRKPEGRTLAAHLGDHDVLFTADRALLIVDHEKGDTMGRVECADAFAAVANSKSNAAYLLSSDGRILCVKPKELPYLRHDALDAARALLNQAPPGQADESGESANPAEESIRPTGDDPFRSRDDLVP